MDIMKKFELWKEVMLKPEPALDRIVKNPLGLKEGAINYTIASAIYMAIASTLGAIFTLNPIGLVAVPFAIILGVIGMLIGSVIMTGIYYVMAMLLGGKAEFKHLYHIVSMVQAPIILCGSISAIPIVGLVALLISLYGLYLQTLAFKKLYKFDTIKAVAVWLVPMVIIFAIMAVAMMVIGVAALGLLMGGAGAFN